MPYAVIKTGGKQYRVEEGTTLLVERLPDDEGKTVELETLLVADGKDAKFGSDLGKATVKATVVGHERGKKLRVVKFKPKRGYKRRTGHRQELTRLRIDSIGTGAAKKAAPAKKKAETTTEEAPKDGS